MRRSLIALTLFGILANSTANAENAAVKLAAFTNSLPSDQVASKAFQEGAQIALEKKSPPALQLQFLDASLGAAPSSPTLKTLTETEKAPLLIYWSTDDVAPVASYLTDANVVGLVGWGVTKQIARMGRTIYGFGYSTEKTFSELAKFAGNKLKSYRFGMISTAASPFDIQSQAFSEQTKSLGNTVVFDEKVDPATADFAALISRAKKETCDTVFAALPASGLITFIKAARAASFKGKILVGDTLFAPDLATLGKDAEGIFMAQSWSDDANFKAAYAAKFGLTPDGVTLGAAALGYDTISCIQNIQPPLDASAITYSFLSSPCEGLTGTTLFSGERQAQRRKKIVTVKNGQFALAE